MQIISALNKECLSIQDPSISPVKLIVSKDIVFLQEKPEAVPSIPEQYLCLQLSSIQKVHFSQTTPGSDLIPFSLGNSDHNYELRTTMANLSLHTSPSDPWKWPCFHHMSWYIYNFCKLTAAQFILSVPFGHHWGLVFFHKLNLLLLSEPLFTFLKLTLL